MNLIRQCRKWLVGVVVVGLFVPHAEPTFATMFNLDTLVKTSGSMLINGVKFSGFQCGTLDVSCGDINVVTLEDGPVGLSFQGALFVQGAQDQGREKTLNIQYDVFFLGMNLITGFSTMMDATRSGGQSSVDGFTFLEPNPGALEIARSYLRLTQTVTDLSDPAWEGADPLAPDKWVFTPLSSLHVVTEVDLYASPGSTASFSKLDNRFIPEPSTLALLAIGAFAYIARGRRNSGWRPG